MTTAPTTPRHLRLVRPLNRIATPDPSDPTIAALVVAATAWKRVTVAPRPVVPPGARHLVVVPDERRHGSPTPTTTP